MPTWPYSVSRKFRYLRRIQVDARKTAANGTNSGGTKLMQRLPGSPLRFQLGLRGWAAVIVAIAIFASLTALVGLLGLGLFVEGGVKCRVGCPYCSAKKSGSSPLWLSAYSGLVSTKAQSYFRAFCLGRAALPVALPLAADRMMGGGRDQRHVLRAVGVAALVFTPCHFLGLG